MLSSLIYSYTAQGNEEIERGERLIKITISDGLLQFSTIITIEVVIINDNAPEILFAGSSNISFMEGAPVPLMLGSVLLPVISDADDTDLFLMESATVELEGAMDGIQEILTYHMDTLNSLNITISGMICTQSIDVLLHIHVLG